MRIKRTTSLGFTEVERAGWDHNEVKIQAAPIHERNEVGLPVDTLVHVLYANGRHGQSNVGQVVKATAAGVKSALRRLRQQEAEQIAAIDAAIGEHEKAIRALQAQRKEVVAKAWTNGHVVRLNEVLPSSDEPHYLDA